MWWLWIGLGVWAGLIIPKWNKAAKILKDDSRWWRYWWIGIPVGFVLTLLAWPVALWNNREK